MAGKDDNRIYHKFRRALECIDPGPYDIWIKGIMAGHSLDPDPDGETYELVCEWSARSAKHDDKEFDYQWNSLKGRPEGQGVGPGTIFYLRKL